jgi:cytochrome c553
LLLAPGASALADSGLPFETLVAVCASCHGVDGHASVVPSWGRLAGQNRGYLVYALRLYRDRGRSGQNAGMMLPYASALSDREIERLAEYYALLP